MDDDDADAELSAVLLHSLFRAPAHSWPEPLPLAAATAVAWQDLGPFAQVAEVLTVPRGVVAGRVAEVLGRAASAGEQLGLAWTCEQDATRWLNSGRRRPLGWQVAARALGEMTSYYALAAAHGLGNVTLRTLLVHRPAAEVVNRRYPKAKGFAPFTDKPQAWVVLDQQLVDAAQAAAVAAGQDTVTDLVDAVGDLVRDPAWQALTRRRNVDFHRWRPQSVRGGAATSNPWDHDATGISLSVGTSTGHRPPDPHAVVQEASQGLAVLAQAMHRWRRAWPGALVDLANLAPGSITLP